MIDFRELAHRDILFTANENMNKFNIGDSIIYENVEYKVYKKVHRINHDYFSDSLKATSEILLVKIL